MNLAVNLQPRVSNKLAAHCKHGRLAMPLKPSTSHWSAPMIAAWIGVITLALSLTAGVRAQLAAANK
jgi:hypothetical protein